MSEAFSLQACQIAVPEKHADRLLTSGFFFHQESVEQADGQAVPEPKGPLALANQVTLAYVLEIRQPWFPSSKVLPTLLATLEEERAKLVPGDQLADGFEGLLRALNEKLNGISESGETDWIGNLNGLVAIVSGDQLHFSQTGRSPAYLLQNNRIRQITDEQQERDPHPLKTFANLASGSLQPDDYLLLANQELYQEISLDALRRIINRSTPFTACQAIARELKKNRNLAVTPVILHVAGGEASAQIAEPLRIVLEDEMQSPLRKLAKRLQPLVALLQRHGISLGKAGLQAARKGKETLVTKVAPAIGEAAKKGVEGARSLATKIQRPATEPAGRPVVEIIHPTKPAEPAPLEEKPQAQVVPPSELQLDSALPIGLMSTEAKGPARLPILSQAKAGANRLRGSRKARLAALAGGIGILLATTGIVAARRRQAAQTPATDQAAQSLQQADALQNKAATAITLSQEVEASREISQGLQLLDGIHGGSAAQASQAETLWASLTSEADQLTRTTRLVSVASYSFPSASDGLLSALPYFYGYSASSGLLRTGRGQASQTQATITLPDPMDAIISLAHTNETDTAAYALTKKNKVLRIIQGDATTLVRAVSPASGDFATGDAISTYNGNVYILDGKTGLLWKYVNSGTSYAKGTSIIGINKYDIKGSISLAIDGSIFLLKQDGTLLRFTSGEQDSFSVKDVPTLSQKLVRPLQVVTDDTAQSVYVLDGGTTGSLHSTAKVLEFNKNGEFIRQYAFPKDYTRISSFEVSQKDKKMWVVNNGQVQEFDL